MIIPVEGHAHVCLVDGRSFVYDATCHSFPRHPRGYRPGDDSAPEFCLMHSDGITKAFGDQAPTIRDLYLEIAKLRVAVNRLYEAPVEAAPAAQEAPR